MSKENNSFPIPYKYTFIEKYIHDKHDLPQEKN
jgi:hypothetical protein